MTGIETVFAILLSGLHWGFASTILWNCLCEIILFTDKLNPSTDNFPFYYINVKFFKKSVKTCDDQKPFPKSCDKTRSPPGVQPDGVFFAYKPRQIGCVGFVGRGRVRTSTVSFARHGAKQGSSGFLVAHRVNHQSDSQRETSAKRVALAEVHKLCVVVFDFLEYGVLLLRQCSG